MRTWGGASADARLRCLLRCARGEAEEETNRRDAEAQRGNCGEEEETQSRQGAEEGGEWLVVRKDRARGWGLGMRGAGAIG